MGSKGAENLLLRLDWAALPREALAGSYSCSNTSLTNCLTLILPIDLISFCGRNLASVFVFEPLSGEQ